MSDLPLGPAMHHLHQRLLAYPETSSPRGADLLALLHDLIRRLDPSVTAEALAPLTNLPLCQPEPASSVVELSESEFARLYQQYEALDATQLAALEQPFQSALEQHDLAYTVTEPTGAPHVLMLMVWLLADDAFTDTRVFATDLVNLLLSADTLMAHTHPNRQDEDQREELIRLTLNGLGQKPQGETDRQAQDRLLMVSSTERARVVAASRAAEERAEAIRQALAEKRAREAADKYTRE
ncbi:hypothetical protein [Saccharospirillum impatiens]|uniref:hypothetical protein n=1 Tax=Saccharospirillum impatiens TaxID=169438 RepID=UPI000684901C|nr:hypothetical protein [Saccharospirillum impatiens]